MTKKLLSYVLTIAMLFNMCISFDIASANSVPDVVFNITGPTEAIKGENVVITVSAEVSAGTDVLGVQADFEYSDGFPEVTAATVQNTLGWSPSYAKISKNNLLGLGDVNPDGGILSGTISFSVPQGAALGTVYTFSFDMNNVLVSDSNGDPIDNFEVTNNSISIEVVDLPPIDGVVINGYSGEYDGEEHTIDATIPSGAEIKYSADNGSTYELDNPQTYVNAGSYTVYYKVTKDGCRPTTGSESVLISPKNITDAMVNDIPSQPYTGSQIKPDVSVADGNLLTDNDYEVEYGENINVSTGGSVTVKGKNNYKGTVIKNFVISKSAMEINAAGKNVTYDGNNHTGSVTTVVPANATVKYGTVDGTYNLDTIPEYKNAGTYVIYYQATDDNYETSSGNITVVINQKEITAAMVKDIAGQDYTGSQITPSVEVTDGSPSIISTNDYDVSYGENINVATGGSITLTGKGNYKGTAVKNFNILPINFPNGSITETEYEDTYNGIAQKATLAIPAGATALYKTEPTAEYTSVVPEFTNAGTYTVYYKVSKPNYIDYEDTMTVKINKKSLDSSMIGAIADIVYTGSEIKPALTVTDGNPSIIKDTDYTVSYTGNINVADDSKAIITAKADGNYQGTAEKSFDITPADMILRIDNAVYTYDGEQHTAVISQKVPEGASIMYGETAGVYDLSQMPTYVNAGVYTVYYKATDANYKDETGSFEIRINPKAVENTMIQPISPVTYNGSRHTPEIVVKNGDTVLIEDTDYTLTYGENINAGANSGSVTITGIGNYTGTAASNFEILKADMTVGDDGYTGIYDGIEHTGSVSVTTPASGSTIMYGTEDGVYNSAVIPKYTNAGEYTVYYKVTCPNYNDVTGSFTVTIDKKALDLSMVDDISAREYTGEQIKPDVTVRNGSVLLTKDTDYTVSFGENINVGALSGSVTITAKENGNYSGTVTKQFEIANAVLHATSADYEGIYDGSYHTGTVTVTEDCQYTIMYRTADSGEYTISTLPEFKDAGFYKVYYKASADNYSDALGIITVTITQKDLDRQMISGIADGTYTYTGLAINPAVTVTDGDPSIITTEDYDVTYGVNVSPLTGGSVTVSGKGNYKGEVNIDFSINKAELLVSTPNKSITYGDAFTIETVYSGFVNSETKDNLTVQPVISGYTQNPDAGEYDLTIGGGVSDNYEFVYDNTSKLTVAKKTVTLTALGVFNKLQDSTVAAVINPASAVLTGVINDDVVLIDVSNAVAEFVSADAGENIQVNITGLALKGDAGANYVLSADNFQTTGTIESSITSAKIAEQITAIIADRNADKIELPDVFEGYTVTIKSSTDETIIDLEGNISDFDTDKSVVLVLTITSEDGTDVADTAPITVTVPAADKHIIAVTTSGNGTVAGGADYFENTDATVTATPDSGYSFGGWYNGATLVSNAATYTFKVTEPLTLDAKFIVVQYSGGGGGGSVKPSKFDVKLNIGDKTETVKLDKNSTVADIPVPTKDGYTFEGWYSDKNLTKKVDLTTKITAELTLYAKWQETPTEEKPEEKPDDITKPVDTVTVEQFTDVSSDAWYYDSVKFACETGLFKGVSNDKFGPDNTLTRAMLVTVIYRLEGEPAIDGDSLFTDVDRDAYYYDALLWANENNIVNGYDLTTFGPDDNVNREQIAAIIARYAMKKGMSAVGSEDIEYSDSSLISDWALDFVKYCKNLGIMLGDNNNNFNSQSDTTRAETATILYRFIQMLG